MNESDTLNSENRRQLLLGALGTVPRHATTIATAVWNDEPSLPRT